MTIEDRIRKDIISLDEYWRDEEETSAEAYREFLLASRESDTPAQAITASLPSPSMLPAQLAAITAATAVIVLPPSARPGSDLFTTTLSPDQAAQANAAAIGDAFRDTLEETFGLDFDTVDPAELGLAPREERDLRLGRNHERIGPTGLQAAGRVGGVDQDGERWADQPPASFNAFYEKYQGVWVRYAWVQTGSREAAEKIADALTAHMAETWRRVQKPEIAARHAWKVLKATVALWIAEQGTGSAFVETAAFNRVERVLERSRARFASIEESLGLYGAIARLPERQYESIVLCFVLGYPYGTAATLLGVTEGSVRSHVRHAKKRLAEDLGIERVENRSQTSTVAERIVRAAVLKELVGV